MKVYVCWTKSLNTEKMNRIAFKHRALAEQWVSKLKAEMTAMENAILEVGFDELEVMS